MFDIGFWELLIIGVIGLLVIGPERLPGVATMVGQWVGRLRRYGRHMQNEIRDELQSEHLRQVLEEQNREMESLRREVEDTRRQTDEVLNEQTPRPASGDESTQAGRGKDD